MKIKRFFIFIFIVLIFFQVKKIITRIQLSQNYYINCDPLFSNQLQFDIKTFINEQLKNKKAIEIYNKLTEAFSIIKSMAIGRKHPDFLSLKIDSQKPLFQINDNLIFTDNNKLIQKHLIKNEFTNRLPTVYNSNDYSIDFLNFLNKVPNYLINDYEINWLKNNSVLLKEKSDKTSKIVISHDSLPSSKLINLCRNIKAQNHNNKKEFNADLRFKNQVVVLQN